MRSHRQNAAMLAAIEVNALRVAEIAFLRRDRDFWRQECLLLGRMLNDLQKRMAKTVANDKAGKS